MNQAKPIAVARVSLPIRRPRREVFLALTDPEMLRQFWPHAAGQSQLEVGLVTEWQMTADAPLVLVNCVEMRPDCLIRLDLSNGARIMLTLDRYEDGGTVVHFCQCCFGPGAESRDISDASRAAARMLSDLKTLLERGCGTDGEADCLRMSCAA